MKNGQLCMKEKVSKSKVIDYKDSKGKKAFGIGHSASLSHTFIPTFKKDQETGLVFTDVAGL